MCRAPAPGNDLLAHVSLQRDAIVGQSLRDFAVTSPSICVVCTGISAGRSVGTMLLWVGAIGVGSEIWNLTPAGMTPSCCRRSFSACRPPRDLGSSSTRSLKAALSWTAHGRSMKPARRYTLGERVGAPKALREDANPNRASRGVAYPSEIIPEWWAKSSRNAERQQIGMRAAARAARPPLRDRGFADSPLEGTGFEPSVPPGLAQLSRLMA